MANLRPNLFVVYQRYQGCWLGGFKYHFAFGDVLRGLLRDRLFGMG
jgi:hypothetical protein